MTGHKGRGKGGGETPESDPSNGSVSASGAGAAAIGGDVSGVVSTGPDAIILQQFGNFFTGEASRTAVPSAGRISLEVIMRGPLRALRLDGKFEEAVAQEEDDPVQAAAIFTKLAQDLSAAGFGGYASAIRRRAAQAYETAGRPVAAAALHLDVLTTGILAGRWGSTGVQLMLLQRLREEQAIGGDRPDAGLSAAVALLEAVSGLFQDPALASSTLAAALGIVAQQLSPLLDSLDDSAIGKDTLLSVAGVTVATIADGAIAAEAFDRINAAADVLNRLADALGAAAGQRNLRLRTRLRLAVAEAQDSSAAAIDGWAQLLDEANRWDLDHGDAALVFARYARARAANAAPDDADAAWRRAVEFAGHAQLLPDTAGWLAAQRLLRHRYGPLDTAELENLRQMIDLLGQQQADRLLPDDEAYEEALGALRRSDGLRAAALAAQRFRVLTAAAGLWQDEMDAHVLLGDIFERSGEPLLAAYHRICAGDVSGASAGAGKSGEVFLDVTAELDRPAAVERSAAYAVLAAQADLIPDALVTLVGERACDDIEMAVEGRIAETVFAGPGVLRSSMNAAATVAGRLPTDVAARLLTCLDRRLTHAKGTHAWTDEAYLQMLVAIAAADGGANAAAAFERLGQLLAIEAPTLQGKGRSLAAAVRRRPDAVRKLLTRLAVDGSDDAAEVLAGWSLTGIPGRIATRGHEEQVAWQAALPAAERAAGKLASPAVGVAGSASLLVHFIGDAGLVTILDRDDIERALDGLLQTASDALHLSATRKQALDAASILVTGDTGDCLGPGRLSAAFELACEYARGDHDGSAMDDMFRASHPLSSFRINMGEASLMAGGLCLAARAYRGEAERLKVLQLAEEILRSRPDEAMLNGVATAVSALPSTDGGPVLLSIAALVASTSESMRAVGALHWALAFGPAEATTGPEEIVTALAADSSPVVRGSLAGQLAVVAPKCGLSAAARTACGILANDPRATIRKAVTDALRSAIYPPVLDCAEAGQTPVLPSITASESSAGDVEGPFP